MSFLKEFVLLKLESCGGLSKLKDEERAVWIHAFIQGSLFSQKINSFCKAKILNSWIHT